MPAGRPLKFQSVEELKEKEDGEYFFCEDKICFNDFARESDLVEMVVNNIDDFTVKYLDDILVSYEINKPISKRFRFSPRGRRIDLFIEGEKGIYIIEAKNAKNTTEIRAAIGQLLDYGREYLDPKKQLLIIANMYDVNTAKTIDYYNLPIRYIVFSKEQSLEYVRRT